MLAGFVCVSKNRRLPQVKHCDTLNLWAGWPAHSTRRNQCRRHRTLGTKVERLLASATRLTTAGSRSPTPRTVRRSWVSQSVASRLTLPTTTKTARRRPTMRRSRSSAGQSPKGAKASRLSTVRSCSFGGSPIGGPPFYLGF